jgi:hypothetical protein
MQIFEAQKVIDLKVFHDALEGHIRHALLHI